MNNVIKTGFYSMIGFFLIGLNNVNAISFDGSNAVDPGLKGKEDQIDKVLEGWLTFLVGFLYLVAIVMIVYGGFNILTAGGDEEKVKKGKTILMQAAGGLIVVFLANSLITWLIGGLFGSASGT